MKILCVFLLLLLITATIFSFATAESSSNNHREFCVIGGGPAGVQAAYFFKRFGISRDEYIVFERAPAAGSFFTFYPRQRNLISINKVHTGTNDTEFNLRHDWNSLLNHEKFDNEADPYKYYPSFSDDVEEQQNGLQDPLLFSEISKEYYPKADTIPEYLRLFTEKYKLNIRYNTDVISVKRNKKTKLFHLELGSSSSSSFTCRAVIMASGKSVERAFNLKEGTKLLTSYTKAPTNPEDYTNQDILILGAGNAAFELARALESHTGLVHIASRNPIQLAYQTHYVGDVRAVNLGFLDRYQLKSMDVLMTLTSSDIRDGRLYRDKETGKICLRTMSRQEENLLKMELGKVGKSDEEIQMLKEDISKELADEDGNVKQTTKELSAEEREQLKIEHEASMEIFPSRRCYHRVISCLGFRFNSSVFTPTSTSSSSSSDEDLEQVKPMTDASDSFIEVASNFESVNVPDLYVAGALAHFRDFKRSAGGFIHGFRYTIRTLVGMLREKYDHHRRGSSSSNKLTMMAVADDAKSSPSPSSNYPFIKMTTREEILNRFMWRLKNVSSLYQMQSQLSDAVLIDAAEDGVSYRYYQDLPFDMLKSKTPNLVSINAFKDSTSPNFRFLTLSLEFGKDFQGVGVLHHQAQQETYKRRAEKMLWDHASPTADPDFRLHQNRYFGEEQPLRKLEKITPKDLMQREQPMMNVKLSNNNKQQEAAGTTQHHMPASPHKTTLLNPLQEPPSMIPGKNGRPPKLNRFLFLHPVVREWKRMGTPVEQSGDENNNNNNKVVKSVKLQLLREVRLHEDVLNDFTGKHHHETPLRNFLEKALGGGGDSQQ